MSTNDIVGTKVIPGPESLAYILAAFGFTVSIEGNIVQMVVSTFPWNILLYALVAAITFWFFFYSGRFQNVLFWVKTKLEEAARNG